MRKRTRTAQQLEFNVTAGTVIQDGDFVWWNGTTLKPVGGAAANLVDTWSSESIAVRDACSRFVGVANFNTYSDDKFDRTYKVDHGCVFEFTWNDTAVPKLGTLVGFKKDSAGNWLYRQGLKKMLDPRDAIGWCTKSYAAAPATVECMLVSPLDSLGGMLGRVRMMSIYSGVLGTAADVVTDWTFGMKVKLLKLSCITAVVFDTADTVLTIKNGANALDDTLTVPTAASAVGKVASKVLDDANAYDVFEHDDAMDIATDGGTTNGAGTLILEYFQVGSQL